MGPTRRSRPPISPTATSTDAPVTTSTSAGPSNSDRIAAMGGFGRGPGPRGRFGRGGLGASAPTTTAPASTESTTAPATTAPASTESTTAPATTAPATTAPTSTESTTAPATAAPATAAPATAAPAGEAEVTVPAWAQGPNIRATLKAGSKGADVEALQAALHVAVTGEYDAATVAAVKAFQAANDLDDDGIAGGGTLRALGLRDDLRSPYHSAESFIPEYRATAYSESNGMRTRADPYAVGAMTNPRQEDDDGGRTYGTYQFESYVYRDGTQKSEAATNGSTLARFVNWADNPYGEELREVVAQHGLASAEFNAAWSDLASRDNRAFGQAQERFLEHDTQAAVTGFYDRAGMPAASRTDPEMHDVAIGTVNQYGGLAKGMADHLASTQKASKTPLSTDQLGRSLQDFKAQNVESNFRRSPNAWEGIRERITRERRMFDAPAVIPGAPETTAATPAPATPTNAPTAAR